MEMIIDYEVEGSWSAKPSKCRACGAMKEIVPQQGHYNSRYWKLKRPDGLLLYCCPEGCSVKDAENKMDYFCSFREYMTEGSESYSYKLDFIKIKYFWLDRKGIMYPCEYREHDSLASGYLDSSRSILEEKGFVISLQEKDGLWIRCLKRITKNQFNILMDWAETNSFKTKDLYEESKQPYFDIVIDNTRRNVLNETD